MHSIIISMSSITPSYYVTLISTFTETPEMRHPPSTQWSQIILNVILSHKKIS